MALMSFITDELFTLGNLVKVHGAMDKSFIDSKSTVHSGRILPNAPVLT